MEKFYKISKKEASEIGRFFYSENEMFDPFVGEQVDGSYIVSETIFIKLQDNENLKKINFKSKKLITDLSFKND